MKNLIFVDLKIECIKCNELVFFESTLVPTKEVTPDMMIEAEKEDRLVCHAHPTLWKDIKNFHNNELNPCYLFDYRYDEFDKDLRIIRKPRNGGLSCIGYRAKIGEKVPGVEKLAHLRGAVEHVPVYCLSCYEIDSVTPNSTRLIKFY